MPNLLTGILLYRKQPDLQLLLAHPGGPLWKEQDEEAWSIPKFEVDSPDLLETTKVQFKNSFGFTPENNYLDLGSITSQNDEKMQVWAVPHDIPDSYIFDPYWFEMEWPPDSGQIKSFPEIDRIEYFGPFEARKKIHPDQRPFISKLITSL